LETLAAWQCWRRPCRERERCRLYCWGARRVQLSSVPPEIQAVAADLVAKVAALAMLAEAPAQVGRVRRRRCRTRQAAIPNTKTRSTLLRTWPEAWGLPRTYLTFARSSVSATPDPASSFPQLDRQMFLEFLFCRADSKSNSNGCYFVGGFLTQPTAECFDGGMAFRAQPPNDPKCVGIRERMCKRFDQTPAL
jgi:hypothetical protein